MTSQYQKYQQQSVSSLTSGEQIVLLFERACLNIAKGIDFIEKGDMNNAHNSIVKAEDIYYYLIDSLDFSYAISSDLFSIYNYIIERMIQANLKKDVSILCEVQKLSCEFRDTWREAERLSRTGGTK